MSVGLQNNRKEVLVLDGGLGTTLEDVFHADIATPLWSANPLEHDPEVIINAHIAFLRAGADFISTSTYQCASSTFTKAGYTSQDARRLMHKAVKLAAEARDRFLIELNNDIRHSSRKIKISLNLGPFGATLTPAQEFDGFYPPPFGPQAYSSSSKNHNAFGSSHDELKKRFSAIDALADFHLERLLVFAEDNDVWNLIDFVAFETVPLTTEIIAIRKAVACLQNRMPTHEMKHWWISTIYPNGQFPEETIPGGRRLSVQEITQALYGSEELLKQGAKCNDGVLAVPTGIGVNCTSLDFLKTVLFQMSTAVEGIREPGNTPPWLVVYPNRGDVYDVVNRTWLPTTADQVGEGWASRLCDVVLSLVEHDAWRGLLIGGCCKTGPAEIAALVKKLTEINTILDVPP